MCLVAQAPYEEDKEKNDSAKKYALIIKEIGSRGTTEQDTRERIGDDTTNK